MIRVPELKRQQNSSTPAAPSAQSSPLHTEGAAPECFHSHPHVSLRPCTQASQLDCRQAKKDSLPVENSGEGDKCNGAGYYRLPRRGRPRRIGQGGSFCTDLREEPNGPHDPFLRGRNRAPDTPRPRENQTLTSPRNSVRR